MVRIVTASDHDLADDGGSGHVVDASVGLAVQHPVAMGARVRVGIGGERCGASVQRISVRIV